MCRAPSIDNDNHSHSQCLFVKTSDLNLFSKARDRECLVMTEMRRPVIKIETGQTSKKWAVWGGGDELRQKKCTVFAGLKQRRRC